MGSATSQQAPPPLKGPRLFFEALLGSGLFTGYFPVAPATVTSLFVLVPAHFLRPMPFWHAVATVVIFFAGVPIATDLERNWGKDPGRVTIDEVVGTLITFFLLPGLTVWGLLFGFLVWRFYDIVKLPFINRSQQLPGGWGIMIDDVLAGICANLSLQLLFRVGPLFVPAIVRHFLI